MLLFSGDPFSSSSWIERVVIEGALVYDRSKDVRMQHLIEGKTPPNTAPMGATAADEKPHDDDGPEDDPKAKKKDDKGEKP